MNHRAQYWLPAAEIFWELFTLGIAFVTSYNPLVVMRFFVGLSATSCYVGLVHIVNTWCRKEELGRQNAIFWVSNPLGQMFAGYLQAATYEHLNNNGGLQGWRYVQDAVVPSHNAEFLIDGSSS
jgi:ACS family pantothenate transporter-like MFS transporter